MTTLVRYRNVTLIRTGKKKAKHEKTKLIDKASEIRLKKNERRIFCFAKKAHTSAFSY